MPLTVPLSNWKLETAIGPFMVSVPPVTCRRPLSTKLAELRVTASLSTRRVLPASMSTVPLMVALARLPCRAKPRAGSAHQLDVLEERRPVPPDFLNVPVFVNVAAPMPLLLKIVSPCDSKLPPLLMKPFVPMSIVPLFQSAEAEGLTSSSVRSRVLALGVVIWMLPLR